MFLYDVARRDVTARLEGAHGDDVNGVAWADDAAQVFYTASDDAECRIWDKRVLRPRGAPVPVGVLVGHTQGLTSVASRGDGRYLVTNSKDQTAKVWDVRRVLSASAAAAAHRKAARVLPDVNWDYRWMRYPMDGLDVRHPADCSLLTCRGHVVLQTLIRAHFSPPSTTGRRFVYTGSSCGAAHVYDVLAGAGAPAYTVPTGGGTVRDLAWHPTLPLLATVSWSGEVHAAALPGVATGACSSSAGGEG